MTLHAYFSPVPGIKRPGREADHSPPSRTEVKNLWSYISTPPIRSSQLKHRDDFTLLYRTLLYFTLLYFTLLIDICPISWHSYFDGGETPVDESRNKLFTYWISNTV